MFVLAWGGVKNSTANIKFEIIKKTGHDEEQGTTGAKGLDIQQISIKI